MTKRRSRISIAMVHAIVISLVSVSAAGVIFLAGCGDTVEETTTSGPTTSTTSTTDYISEALAFPVDDYVVQTKKVGTADGLVNIEYHLYRHITYVADPVDPDYQSLDIAIPVEIDGTAIDASDAPILFNIDVEDYLASANLSPAVRAEVSATTTTSTTTTSTTTSTTALVTASTTTETLIEDIPDDVVGDETDDQPLTTRGALDTNADLALAAGYVVVTPGCRGSDNVNDDEYFGKAPASIVDLKCAIKYLRFNDAVIPGSANRIIAQGVGAGGALAALLGASGNSELYQSYFDELGAAPTGDGIYACAAYCPTTDLDHADGAYEWQFGTTPFDASLVDLPLSAQLASGFAAYLTSLDLVGRSGFGTISADNYADYLIQTYLAPAAKTYLDSLSEEDLAAYLVDHLWITWMDGAATFTWNDYVDYAGRMKDLPAFDAFDLSTPECALFGDSSTEARHFTTFSLRQTGEGIGSAITVDQETATLDEDLQTVVNMMNPMYFILDNNSGCAHYWWIRQGTRDNDTSLAIAINLTTSLENLGKEVNTTLYWDAVHGANEDPADFVDWIDFITSTGG